MARIVRRPLAGADIAEIWDYIAEDSVDQADAWVDRLDAKLRLLASQPAMGRARDELSPGLRSMPFGRHVIFYETMADGIDVARVLHSARDIDAVFEKESLEP
jgi:toxin ParE1/3/4